MDHCCGCLRKWTTIRKKDGNTYSYRILDDEMADFFAQMSGHPISKDWTICKRCQNKYNTKRTAERRRRERAAADPTFSSSPEEEPVAGPSGLQSFEPRDDEEEVASNVSSLSITPSIFSPMSFTPPPSGTQMFTFPSASEASPIATSAGEFSEFSSEVEVTGSSSSDDEDDEGEEFIPRFRLSISSHRSCVYGCQSESMNRIPESFRAETLILHQIHIPVCARRYATHCHEILESIITESYLNYQQYEDALQLLMKRVKHLGTLRIPDSSSQEAGRIKSLTTLSPENFDDLVRHLNGFKDPRQSLGAFLNRLKTGLPIKDIAMLFNFDEKTFSRQAKKIRDQLYQSFVPQNLGFAHLRTREQTFSHSTFISNKLMLTDTQRQQMAKTTIWDGTYIYIQRSINIPAQKKSFSGQKKANLFKPMICVFPDGYIYEIFSYNAGTSNDASILQNLMVSIPNFSTIFKKGDVFVLDRGFRDVSSELRRRGYTVFMPALTTQRAGQQDDRQTWQQSSQQSRQQSGQRKQLTWQQANQSRRVTKVRWVVEAVIGRLKTQFRLMHHILQNTDIRSKNFELKICCAILNKYGQRFISDRSSSELIVERIISRMDVEQRLVNMVRNHNLTMQRTMFRNLDLSSERLLNPPLSMQEFHFLATGSYLLKYIDAYKSASKQANLHVSVSEKSSNSIQISWDLSLASSFECGYSGQMSRSWYYCWPAKACPDENCF